MNYHDKLSAIELAHGVNVDISDEANATFVYAYTEDGDRLGFEFNSMSPDIADVKEVALAIESLKWVCNRRPRVGRVQETT